MPKLCSLYVAAAASLMLAGILLSSPAASAASSSGGNSFSKDCDVTWGEGRGQVLNNGQLVTLSLDKTSGSGFQSKDEYMYCNIDIQIKLVRGNSAGTVTTYYLSSEGPSHDELDMEFLGNETGQPYTLHTNIYTQGKGNREMQFKLWFDPTAAFHTYSFRWTPRHVLFMVDGTPIREFKNMESKGIAFPQSQPMRLFCTIWDGEEWATQGGRVKTDWSQAPFQASFQGFNADEACVVSGPGAAASSCSNNNAWYSQDLDATGQQSMSGVQKSYMIYDYCDDYKRFPQGFPPECSMA